MLLFAIFALMSGGSWRDFCRAFLRLVACWAFEPQNVLDVHNVVYGPFKQTTFGTPLLLASMTQRPRGDNSFAVIDPEFYSDIAKTGKGHQWPTIRTRTRNKTAFGATWDVDSANIGWLLAFAMGADTVTGIGPFVHTFKFLQSSNQMPVTSLYFEDTADVLYQMTDLAVGKLVISGGDSGPLTAQFEMTGSGHWTDGSVTKPAVPTPTFLMGSDTDILIGAPGGSTSKKERVRSWSVSVDVALIPHYAPGGGLFATFMKLDTQRASVQIVFAAKDVDDIRTLINGDTLQELKINTNSGASAQCNLFFPGLYFKGKLAVGDNNEEVWQLESTEMDVVKTGSNEIFQATVTNSVATYLTAG